MDLSGVRYFLAICAHGSFTAAARACGVTQPAVTAGLARLERALGGRLVERSHPVRPTPFGAELRPLMEDLRDTADRVVALSARRARRPARGATSLSVEEGGEFSA